MAASMLSAVTRSILRSHSILSVTENIHRCATVSRLTGCHGDFHSVFGVASITVQRKYSFFTNLTADELWRGATGVSSVGRKRGRAKGSRRKIDLNFGKSHGHGKKKFGYLGLNVPILDYKSASKDATSIKKLSEEESKVKENKFTGKRKLMRLRPLERGWTGRKLPGVNVGPPDSIGDYDFHGFRTILLESKVVSTMTSVMKKKIQQFALVVTGNENGLAGHAIGKAPKIHQAIKTAINKAGQHLQYIERYENHTVYHNFYCKMGNTAVLAKKKEKGYGLKCHRAIKDICELVGIKDLHVKIIGRINMHNVVRAFFHGLRNQQTFQELANRRNLHVVEYRPERGNIPLVVASPSDGIILKEVKNKEKLDFEHMFYEGRRELIKPEKKIFFYNNPAYHRKKRVLFKRRNQPEAQRQRKMCGLEPSHDDRKRLNTHKINRI